MDVLSTCPTREACGRACVAGGAIPSVRCHVIRIGGGAQCTFCAFAEVRAVVAGVAAGRAHRRVGHRVADETRRGIGMAIAALDAGDRDMRRGRHAQRNFSIVTSRANRIAWLMNVCPAGPTRESRGSTRMAGDAVSTARRDVVYVRGGTERTFRSFARI